MASGLTHYQNNEYTRGKRLQQVFLENGGIVSGFAALQTAVTSMNTHITALEGFIPGKIDGSGGVAQSNEQTLIEIAGRTENICSRARAFALKTGNVVLADATNVPAWKIKLLKVADVLPKIQTINSAVSPYVATSDFMPYGVTATMLTDLVTLATGYNMVIGAPKEASSATAVANEQINAEVVNLRGNNKQLVLLVRTFKPTNPAFYTAFTVNNELPKLGVRVTTLEGTIINKLTGATIEGVQVKNLLTGKLAMSDIGGAYQIRRFRPGTFNFEVSAPGYVTQVKTIKIGLGKTVVVDLEMVFVSE